ncbi:BREX-2 system adenine-specific DNA-methyltransferase PglX [Nakamurella endophytica]|uniref:site-specific DNA-methyltransferase (adenine-specific) n=1 Tax=Nakamurella endophytica TaxID=1748367 RepID=A0A917SUR9_9ACTN|nr:BREX-2 system adenine-specific DNA-methyltransferase PglX [Nakamurella endophytica]GGL99877.1 DNA methylase [Nakamurella endophytica]
MATATGPALTAALKPQLATLVADLRDRTLGDPEGDAAWRTGHQAAVAAQRTAGSFEDWSTDQLTQAAVGWLLGSVFVRFCEDNLLLGGQGRSRTAGVWITSNDRERRQAALDAERAFYLAHSDYSYREWLEVAFAALADNPATAALVGEHSASRIAAPSSEAVGRLLEFWRQTDDDGNLRWDFADPQLSTRFLGDVYQDLSDYAKERYALLQTPDFVEEFILDQTLEPALADRPLEGFRMIDPTCGSGHFLLGSFQRLLARWQAAAPGLSSWQHVQLALDGVHGVDLNPFAVAIARFRLTVAALKAAGEVSLVDAPEFQIHVAVGDSLLHGESQYVLSHDDRSMDLDVEASGFAYRTEDLALLRSILMPGRYDAVVGNPPYIVARDKALNARYRELYKTCKGTYALTVPFMERFFQLAKPGDTAGWVGQITSNSFMKREFGAPLIEKFLANRDLRLIVDTSGAHIPGHNTPTVILIGRNDRQRSTMVRAVLGIRGELGRPAVAAEGKVWSSIAQHVGAKDFEDEWLSVTDVARQSLAHHPWSLSGGASPRLARALSSATSNLSSLIEVIGRTTHTGLDDAFYVPLSVPLTYGFEEDVVPVVLGENVRNFVVSPALVTLFPYRSDGTPARPSLRAMQSFWRTRAMLERRVDYDQTLAQRGLRWFDHSMFFAQRYITPLSLAFPFVATHNHFVLDRGGKAFNRTAPVIKLPAGATEDDHLRLLGVLNSSTACFWLRAVCFQKDGSGEPWERRHEFDASKVSDLPLPRLASCTKAHILDTLAQQWSALSPASTIERSGTDRVALKQAEEDADRTRRQMIAHQEELDWEVYQLYALLDEDLTYPHDIPQVALGERAFEIALARKVAAGTESTEWFARHGSTPITEIPKHWPADYRALVQRRLDLIESDRFVNLLERPEYKRRWQGEPWSKRLTAALRDHLLIRLESRSLWFDEGGRPRPRSVNELADVIETHPEFDGLRDALDQWAGQVGAPVVATLQKLLDTEHVPYLAALRYKADGLRKRAEWERTWAAQREEDAGVRDPKADPIPVPPKYTGADFLKTSYWSHRGKLDVPKERFISYPGGNRATDGTLLLGWAGWNHAQQALALGVLYSERSTESFDPSVLTPLLAGIEEQLPWVRQWHSGPDPDLGVDLAGYLDGQVDAWSAELGIARSDLPNWRPVAAARGRRPRVTART